jgi:ribosomal-protein-alanine N-acetyltransferase
MELKLIQLEQRHTDQLAKYFKALVDNGDTKWFRPFELTDEQAAYLCNTETKDKFYFLEGRDLISKKNEYVVSQNVYYQYYLSIIVGFGMLRGWNQGYDVPSLGISIHPDWRAKGLGRKFMNLLHKQAIKCGASKVRLSVYPDNTTAITLYNSMGYGIIDVKEGQTIMEKSLDWIK